jgi:hypothetical protein
MAYMISLTRVFRVADELISSGGIAAPAIRAGPALGAVAPAVIAVARASPEPSAEAKTCEREHGDNDREHGHCRSFLRNSGHPQCPQHQLRVIEGHG